MTSLYTYILLQIQYIYHYKYRTECRSRPSARRCGRKQGGAGVGVPGRVLRVGDWHACLDGGAASLQG